MANKKRYSFVFHSKNGEKNIISIHFKDGKMHDSFALTEVDCFTTAFPNADVMARFLKIPKEDYEGGYFAIEYKSNGRFKSLELVFDDSTFLRKLAKDNFGESKLSKESITSYMRWFLNKIEREPEFLKYISTHRYTNSYFKSALSNYLMLKNSDEKEAQSVAWQAEVRLKKEFMRYKTLRGLEVGRRNYELEKENKIVPRNPDELTLAEQAQMEYEMNHPKKVKKRKPKKSDPIDGQLPLFDATPYTDSSIYEHKRTRR